MGFGLKRIFRRKKVAKAEKHATTPPKGKKSDPVTPPTHPVKEDRSKTYDGETRDDDERFPTGSKNLVDDLNVSGSNNSSELELAIRPTTAQVPDDEPPMEDDEEVPYSPSNLLLPGIEDDETSEATLTPDTSGEQKETPSTPRRVGESKEEDDDVDSSDVSPLRPRKLLEPADDLSVSFSAEEQLVGKEVGSGSPNRVKNITAQVSNTLLGIFEKAKECATGAWVPEPSVKTLVPTVDNALCHPLAGTRSRSDLSTKRPKKLVRQYSYYDEQFALKILDELINVGYALVNHQQLIDDVPDEEGDWVGRSVTLILKPGTCNVMEVKAPYLEWATLGGGQQNGVETTQVSLLDIHSIAMSSAEDMAFNDGEDNKENDAEEVEDLECFFSLTTKQGQIHVMEAITADESQRLVAGVRNLASRLAKQLITGDKAVLWDFFDNSLEPEEIRVTEEEAMARVSHTLLDYMSKS